MPTAFALGAVLMMIRVGAVRYIDHVEAKVGLFPVDLANGGGRYPIGRRPVYDLIWMDEYMHRATSPLAWLGALEGARCGSR